MTYHYVLTVQAATSRGVEVYETSGTVDIEVGMSRHSCHTDLKASLAGQLHLPARELRTLFWSIEPDALA